MITPSFSLTATERVLPKLALDFTTAALDPRVTFTRTTSASNPATYTDSNGLIALATNNQPRFDYNPITLVCKGLLIEESRANLFQRSDDFANAYWTATNASVGSNAVTAPDGTLTGDKLIENTSVSVGHKIESTGITVTSGTNYSYSVYAKPAGRDWVVLELQGSLGGGYAWFNVSTGAIGTQTGLSGASTITAVGNGWYRCSITDASTGVGSHKCTIWTANADNSVNYTGDGVSGIYIWGAQLETGAFATSYIPTTTTSLTRNADVATMTGTNFSSWFNATEGAFEVESILLPGILSGFPAIYTASDGTANNLIFSSYNAGGPSAGFTVKTLGSNVANMFQTVPAFTATSVNKVCGAYKTNSFAASANGTAPSTDSAGALPTVNQLSFGSNLWVRELNYWPQRLTNAEVQAFAK